MYARPMIAGITLVAMAGVLCAIDPPLRALPPVTPGKSTTVVTGPLDKSGQIDYESALNERMKGKTTPKTNAVVLLIKAIGPTPEGARLHKDYYNWLGTTKPPDEGTYLLWYLDFFGDDVRGEDLQALFDRDSELRTRPWTEKDEPKFADWLRANGPALKVVAEAARRPDYFYPFIARKPDGTRDVLIGSLLSTVQKTREVASLLGLRVMYHCGAKKYDAAWQDVITLHRLGRLLSKGGSLIELLVGIAIDAIARNAALRFLEASKPDAKRALTYRDDLLKLPPLASVADKVDLSERFTFLDSAQAVRRNGVSALTELIGLARGNFPEVPAEVVEATLFRLDWDRVLKTGNGWYDRMTTALRKPTRAERQKALAAIEVDLKRAKQDADFLAIVRDSADAAKRGAASDRAGDLLVNLLMPTVLKVSEASDRQEVRFRTEVLAFALAAHFADHKKYPAKLADLVPKYAKAIPDDIYSGKPLIYKPTVSGYELYSVGTNGKDDGGQSLDDEPRGDDYGVRMPFMKRTPTPGDDRR